MPSEKLIKPANIWLPCTEYVISAGLLWFISLVKKKKNQQVWKKWNFEYKIVASTFNACMKDSLTQYFHSTTDRIENINVERLVDWKW